jgi:hypothetical protein
LALAAVIRNAADSRNFVCRASGRKHGSGEAQTNSRRLEKDRGIGKITGLTPFTEGMVNGDK